MGQGPSSAGLGSNDDTTSAVLNEEIMQLDAGTPNLLADHVRECLDSEGLDGNSQHIIDPPDGAKEPESVPAVFTWPYGGENVYITGSFNQWSGKIPMYRSNKDFAVILELPPGVIQYKFIVDDQWRFAPDQPTVVDAQGVINNQIEIKAPEQENNFENDDADGCGTYGQVEPCHDNYAKDPPPLPPHLGIILLNSDEIAGQNDAVMLPVPQHVTLSHLYASRSETAAEEKVCVLGITQRYMSKFVTTVYYRPNPLPGTLPSQPFQAPAPFLS
uniref:Association with the SNF1 complex (ASC) domain-containing protein n=1 Tax=Spongospora subterranea TaxID=70186 RepID=A0A0H5R2N2_9EUKA|eukprot:CRZ08211.1 hypothetical protein [Spongospora subterranea]